MIFECTLKVSKSADKCQMHTTNGDHLQKIFHVEYPISTN